MKAVRRAANRLNEVASAVLDGLAWEAARKAVDVVRYQPRQLDFVLACGLDQPEVPLPVTRWLVEARTWPALRHLSTIPHRLVRLVAAEAARWLGPTGSAVVRWSSGAVAAAVDHAGASTLQQPLRARAHPGMLVPHPHQVAVIAVDMRGFSNLTRVLHDTQYLADLIGDQNIKIYSRYDPESKIDVEVYLGYDWANKNTLP